MTYECKAKPVQAVLDDLSRLSGLKLSTRTEMQPEIVLVSVDKLPVETLLDRLAKVTSGQWEGATAGYILAPNLSARQKEQNAETAKLAEIYRRDVDAGLADAEKAANAPPEKPKKDGNMTSWSYDPVSATSNIVIYKLLKLADYDAIARLPDTTYRLVWASNAPTATQVSLQEGGLEIAREWVAAHNAASKKLKSAEKTFDVEEEFHEADQPQNKEVEGAPAKVVLAVSKSNKRSLLSVSATCYDRNGNELLTANGNVSDPQSDSVVAPPPKSTTKINFSEEAKQFRQIFEISEPGEASLPKPSVEFLAKAVQIDKFDPLSYVASEALLAYAKSKGRQLIADIPDSFPGVTAPDSTPDIVAGLDQSGMAWGLMQIGWGSPSVKTLEDVEEALGPSGCIQAEDGGQILCIMPSSPALDRSTRVDRRQLRALSDSDPDSVLPSLDMLAAYAVHNPSLYENPVSAIFTNRFLRGAMIGGELWEGLRFLGLLNPTQRASLEGGGTLPLASLSLPAQAQAEAMLYGASASIGDDKVGRPLIPLAPQWTFGIPDAQTAAPQTEQGPVPEPPRNYRLESTELMPAGIPSAAYVSTEVLQEQVFFAKGADGPLRDMTLDPAEIALFKFQGAKDVTLPGSGVLGTRSLINLIFHVGPKLGESFRVADVMVPRKGAAVSYGGLPTAFLASIAKAAKQLNPPATG